MIELEPKRTVAEIQAELEARLAVGHEATCRSCGLTIVRIAPPARSLAEDAVRFGEPEYSHPGYLRCPGRPANEALRIERGRP